MTPGGLSFQNPFRCCGMTGPTHRCKPRQRLAVGTELRRYRQEARCRDPSRRDHAAWTSGAWVRISTPRTSGHRIPPRVRDADQTPSVGAGRLQD